LDGDHGIPENLKNYGLKQFSHSHIRDKLNDIYKELVGKDEITNLGEIKNIKLSNFQLRKYLNPIYKPPDFNDFSPNLTNFSPSLKPQSPSWGSLKK